MKKRKVVELSICDSGDSVNAIFTTDGNIRHNYLNNITKPVRVRLPLPEKDTFNKRGETLLKKGLGGTTIEEQLNFYIKCREKDISEEYQKIRKSIKRIDRQLECILLAEKYTDEYKKT